MQTGRDAFTPDLSVLRGDTKYRIAAYKEGMPFDEYSERLNLAVSVTDDGRDPSGGGEQGGGDNGGTNQGNSGSMNGGQGNNGVRMHLRHQEVTRKSIRVRQITRTPSLILISLLAL